MNKRKQIWLFVFVTQGINFQFLTDCKHLQGQQYFLLLKLSFFYVLVN